jgi:uncharacterized protein with PQ loop repeat
MTDHRMNTDVGDDQMNILLRVFVKWSEKLSFISTRLSTNVIFMPQEIRTCRNKNTHKICCWMIPNVTSVQTGLEKFVVFSEAIYKRTDVPTWWERFLCDMCRSVRLLGVFGTYRNATSSCVMSVCLSGSMRQLGCHWMEFHEILYFIIFRKYVQKIQDSLKFDNNQGHFTRQPVYIFDHVSFLLRMRKIAEKIYIEIQNPYFTRITFFPKIVPFMR